MLKLHVQGNGKSINRNIEYPVLSKKKQKCHVLLTAADVARALTHCLPGVNFVC